VDQNPVEADRSTGTASSGRLGIRVKTAVNTALLTDPCVLCQPVLGNTPFPHRFWAV